MPHGLPTRCPAKLPAPGLPYPEQGLGVAPYSELQLRLSMEAAELALHYAPGGALQWPYQFFFYFYGFQQHWFFRWFRQFSFYALPKWSNRKVLTFLENLDSTISDLQQFLRNWSLPNASWLFEWTYAATKLHDMHYPQQHLNSPCIRLSGSSWTHFLYAAAACISATGMPWT